MPPDPARSSLHCPLDEAEAPGAPPEIAVTGVGAVSALGWGLAPLLDAIAAGRDGVRPIERFPTAGFSTAMAALVPDAGNGFHDDALARGAALDGPWARFALAAAREALAMAGASGGARLGLVLGTLRGHDHGLHRLAEAVGGALGAGGPRINVAAACSSSTHALALAIDLLREGQADQVLAGGVDVVTPDMFAGFAALGLLAPERCAPFSLPPGTTLGEGAALLLLERGAAARARGAVVRGTLLGYGLSADAYHATSPDPTGAGLARAMSSALADAGLATEAIGYVNAHGTGTEANDAAEWQGLRRALGERAGAIPISSSKSIFGHAQGAAGALEAVVTLEALARQEVPPTLHAGRPRPRLGLDLVAEGRPRPHRFTAALSNSAAFGGANGVLALGLPGRRGRACAARTLWVRGTSSLGPHGDTAADLRALMDGTREARAVAPPALEALVPMGDTRALDPTGRFLVAAAARALAEAEVRLRDKLRDRAGLFVGSCLLSPASGHEFNDSIARRGLARLSASAFTRIVLNAPAGACTLLLGLRGPTTTVGAGAASGAAAIWHAAAHLARHDDVDLLVAGGVHEAREPGQPEGAALIVLDARPGGADRGDGTAVRLVGWGLAGAGQGRAAIEASLAMAGHPRCDLVATLGIDAGDGLGLDDPALGRLAGGPGCERLRLPAALAATGSAASALLVVAAIDRLRRLRRLRRRGGGAALVAVDAPDAAACALVFSTGTPG